jgi:hypothetical protein
VPLAAAWLLSACVSEPIGPFDQTWFACTRNRNCEIFEDPTCALIPINKRYAEPFAQRMRLEHRLQIATKHCSRAQARDYDAVCEVGRCVSALRHTLRRRAAGLAEPTADRNDRATGSGAVSSLFSIDRSSRRRPENASVVPLSRTVDAHAGTGPGARSIDPGNPGTDTRDSRAVEHPSGDETHDR